MSLNWQEGRIEPTKGDLGAEDVANTLLAQGYRVMPRKDEQWLVISDWAEDEQLLWQQLRPASTAVYKSLKGSTYLEDGPQTGQVYNVLYVKEDKIV